MTTPPWCREKVMVYYYYYYKKNNVCFLIKYSNGRSLVTELSSSI